MPTAGDSNQRFLQEIHSLAAILDRWRAHLATTETDASSEAQPVQHHLLDEFCELLSIFCMIHAGIGALARLDEERDGLLAPLPSPSPSPAVTDPPQPVLHDIRVVQDPIRFIPLTTAWFDVNQQTIILVKTVYEWLYHIRELLEKVPALRPSPALWSQLTTHCEFRNKLVMHRTRARAHLRTMSRTTPSTGGFELSVMPFPLPKPAQAQINTLFLKCQPLLTPDEAAAPNAYERCRILYHNLDRFCGPQQGEIYKLIERYGTFAVQPADLAQHARKLAEEVSAKLPQAF